MADEFKEISLKIGSLPWDSKYNINAVVINMITDMNDRLLSIPVNKTLYQFVDSGGGSGLGFPVTILAIIRANASSSVYNESLHYSTFISTYAIITSTHTPSGWDPEKYPPCIFIATIDENSHTLITGPTALVTGAAIGADIPELPPNFMNRGKFWYAQNSADQCAFIDDDGGIFVFRVATAETEAALRLTYSSARAFDTTNNVWTTLGLASIGTTDAVEATGFDGQINYQKLLNAPNDTVASKQKIVVVMQDYGIVYNETQNLLFFTEAGNLKQILWLKDQYPTFTVAGTTKTVTRKGVPNVILAPGRVVDMVAVNSTLYIYTQEMIYPYNLVVVNGNPTLQQITNQNLNFKIRLNSGVSLYQGTMYFITQDDKMYALNTKGAIVELTNRILPDNYNFKYNTFVRTVWGVDTTYQYLQSRVLIPVRIGGMSCLVNAYNCLNLETGFSSFLIPNANVDMGWYPDDGSHVVYSQPKRITAASDDGRYAGMSDIWLFMASDFDNTISDYTANPDYFAAGLIISDQKSAVGSELMTLKGLEITFRDSNFDPVSEGMYDAITLGIYIVVDQAFDAVLMEKLLNDTWWDEDDSRQKTLDRLYSTNTFITSGMNITCRSYMLCIRFSKNNAPTDPQFDLQKFAVMSIITKVDS